MKNKEVSANAALGNFKRQYVGARYVPKFFQNPNGTAEWLGNVPYEALTVVSYLGNSYTSKIPVPAGIGNPSLNPTYWALTGNYNEQLNQYLQEVSELTEKYEDLNAYYEKLNEDLSVIKDKYFLNAMYPNSQRSFILIGDSYGVITDAITPGNTLPDYFINAAGSTGVSGNIKYSFNGGAGFAVEGNSFLDIYTQLAASNSVFSSNASDVVVIGGCNDAGKSGISDAIQTFLNYVKVHSPKAVVHIVPVGNFFNATQKKLLYNTYQNYKSSCSRYGAHFIDGFYTYLNFTSYMYTDGIHPTIQGTLQLGRDIFESVYYYRDAPHNKLNGANTFQGTDNVSILNSTLFNWENLDGTTHFTVVPTSIRFSGIDNLSNGNKIPIGNLVGASMLSPSIQLCCNGVLDGKPCGIVINVSGNPSNMAGELVYYGTSTDNPTNLTLLQNRFSYRF